MSDDDHKNVELITEEMRELKRKYPEMSFFVIETFKDSFAKFEILQHETREVISAKESVKPQLSLFD
jgi:N6-adenosine-specific RNA methylase IME4